MIGAGMLIASNRFLLAQSWRNISKRPVLFKTVLWSKTFFENTHTPTRAHSLKSELLLSRLPETQHPILVSVLESLAWLTETSCHETSKSCTTISSRLAIKRQLRQRNDAWPMVLRPLPLPWQATNGKAARATFLVPVPWEYSMWGWAFSPCEHFGVVRQRDQGVQVLIALFYLQTSSN